MYHSLRASAWLPHSPGTYPPYWPLSRLEAVTRQAPATPDPPRVAAGNTGFPAQPRQKPAAAGPGRPGGQECQPGPASSTCTHFLRQGGVARGRVVPGADVRPRGRGLRHRARRPRRVVSGYRGEVPADPRRARRPARRDRPGRRRGRRRARHPGRGQRHGGRVHQRIRRASPSDPRTAPVRAVLPRWPGGRTLDGWTTTQPPGGHGRRSR